MEHDSLQQAIYEQVEIVPYDPAWPQRFEAERSRLIVLLPELTDVEHFGSTAVPGLCAKPVIDILAIVASMDAADRLLPKLCENGYVASPEFNATLPNRRWLMRYAAGRRTHHLHLVLPNSCQWNQSLRFRDMLRRDPKLADEYAELKRALAKSHPADREAYTSAKGDFIRRAQSRDDRHLNKGIDL